jgi:hypothetical protein
MLPTTCRYEQVDSDSGDHCHYLICDLHHKRARSVLLEEYENRRQNFFICQGDNHRPLTDEDIQAMIDAGITM